MQNKLLRKGLIIGLIILLFGTAVGSGISSISNYAIYSFSSSDSSSFDPFKEGWEYRKKITIDHDQVDGNLSDFPVLISITDTNLRDKAQEDGDDILFMDGPGIANQLNHEIEYFDGSSGELIAWVNITAISDVEDTEFYMYYGNQDCNDQQNVAGTWDSGFDAVWHMDYDSGIQDSTSNDYDATRYGSVSTQSGLIGWCQKSVYNDGGSNYIESDDAFFNEADTSFTWDFWIYVKNNYKYMGTLGTKNWHNYGGAGQNDYKGYIYFPNGKIHFYLDSGDGTPTYIVKEGIVCGNWYFINYKRNGNSVKLYIDGVEQGECYTTWTESRNTEMRLFNYYANTWQKSLDGRIDEVRFSNVARSDSWIKTSYNAMNDPSSFLSFGSEESNQPPDVPIIDGPTTGKIGVTLSYTFVTEDPDGDDVYYEIDWGDGVVDPWDGPHESKTEIVRNHVWFNQGVFLIRARAKDVYDSISKWSDPFIVVIENNPPDVPIINGPTTGKTGVEYEYDFITADPEYQNVYLWIEWGDGDFLEWIGPYYTGEIVTLSHTWSEEGTFLIKAKAKDPFDEEGCWGMLVVNMPRTKVISNSLFLWLLEQFPLIERLLKII